MNQAQLLPGTLDLLILRAVSLGPLHGYGILLRIGQISGNALLVEQGALYPGLFRLVRQDAVKFPIVRLVMDGSGRAIPARDIDLASYPELRIVSTQFDPWATAVR